MGDLDPEGGNEEPTYLDSESIEEAEPQDLPMPGEPAETVRRLGDYELLREIGRGGMGLVYEARQISLSRQVALKVLPPALGLSSQAKQRFEREARAAAKLHHTNIVPVYAIGEQDGHHFYAMELIEGDSLDIVLRDLRHEGSNPLMETSVQRTSAELEAPHSPAPTAEASTTSLSDTSASSRKWFDTVAKLVGEVADALQYAHGRGIIHRDIKPGNLILSSEGRLCVTDFGLARMLQEPGVTHSGSFLGTPAYMAPEQIAAGRINVDHRADVYSLGAVLYELLTLERPFDGDNREQVLARVLTKDPRPPRRHNHKIPVDLDTICLKALEKDPDRRYQSADDLSQDLRQYLARGLITARRAGIARRSVKLVRRNPVVTMAVASLLAIALVLGGAFWFVRSAQRGEVVRQAIASARTSLTEGLYKQGLADIDRALELAPDSADAQLVRARLLIQLDRRADAVEQGQELLARRPDDWTVHLILASAAGGSFGSVRFPQIDVSGHVDYVQTHAPESADAYFLRSTLAPSPEEKLTLLNRALELDPRHADALVERIYLNKDERMNFEAALADCQSLVVARPRSALGHRMKARVLLAQTRYDEAFEWIEKAVKVDSADSYNYIVRAMIYRDTGRLEDAIADLDLAVKLEPGSFLHLSERAATLQAAGESEQARDAARAAIALNPDYLPAHRTLFEALHALEQRDELRWALGDLSLAAEEWQDVRSGAAAQRVIADYYRRLGDNETALAAADRIVKAAPGDFRGRVVRAKILRDIEDGRGLREDCGVIAGLSPRSPIDNRDHGYAMGFECGDWEMALRDFERLVDAFPRWFGAYYARGTANLQLDHREQALADLDEAIRLAPNFAPAYSQRGTVLERLERHAESLADRERSLELNPDLDALAWSNLGMSYFREGKLEQAQKCQRRAIEIDRRFANAYVYRAMFNGLQDRCGEAVPDLDRAVELAMTGSGDDWAVVYLNLALAHSGALYYSCPDVSDAEAALAFARKGYEKFPHDLLLAYGLYRNGDFEEAGQALERWHAKNDGPWFLRAMVHWKNGRRAEARADYDKSVEWLPENWPHHPIYLKEKAEAAELLGVE